MNNISLANFVSGRGRAKALIVLFVVMIIVNLLAICADYGQINLLSRAISGATVTMAEAQMNDAFMAVTSLLTSLLFFTIGIIFLMWIYRVHKNLSALGACDLKFTSGWAVGYFFVPFYSFFRPCQIVTEIWKASDPTANEGHLLKNVNSSPLVGLWWVAHLAMNILSLMATAAITGPAQHSVSELRSGTISMLVADVVAVLAAVLAMLVIKAVDTRQEEKHRLLLSAASAQETHSER
ncbi:MAG: DUF4328 domain-containing protein [Armatimonadota bacterium]|nr:DUF4328 domain-containing protein [Armatimonadota bacterium]